MHGADAEVEESLKEIAFEILGPFFVKQGAEAWRQAAEAAATTAMGLFRGGSTHAGKSMHGQAARAGQKTRGCRQPAGTEAHVSSDGPGSWEERMKMEDAILQAVHGPMATRGLATRTAAAAALTTAMRRAYFRATQGDGKGE